MTRARDVANVLSTATSLATDTETAAAISSHNSATTSVHGITNTATLATQTYADSAVSTHAAASDPHAGYVLESLIDAKGDLIVGSADNTVAKLSIGNSGDSIVANSAAATGLSYKEDYAAGKNKIINGDFGIWQRGTSFTISGNNTYTADRFISVFVTAAPTSWVVSREAFTLGTAPVAGYESAFFYRSTVATVGTATGIRTEQRIENVRTFAGEKTTFSFWAKAAATTSLTAIWRQSFGTGGSAEVTADSNTFTLTTDWQRFTYTIDMPSISGKTIGTGNTYVFVRFTQPTNAASTVDLWGLQWEASPVATAFNTATGTIQGELAACQRYYWRTTSNGTAATVIGQFALASSTTLLACPIQFPVTMRVTPTSVDFSSLAVLDVTTARINVTAVALDNPSPSVGSVLLTSSGLTSLRSYILYNQSAATGFIGFSAEL